MRKFISLIALILFYLILTIVVMEGGLRLFNKAAPAQSPGFFWRVPDATTGWGLIPNEQGRWFNPMYEYDVDVAINSSGLRSPGISEGKADNLYRVLVLGDSYVEALQVPLEESFPQQVATHLTEAGMQTEIIHAGVSGWGTDQQLLWLREFGAQYQPDLVLLAVYPGNDFMNNHMPLEFANFGGVRKPWFALENSSLVVRDFPFDPEKAKESKQRFKTEETEKVEDKIEAEAEDQGPLATVGAWLKQRSAFYRYLDPRLRVTMPGVAIQLGKWGLIEPGQESKAEGLDPAYIPVTYGVYQQPPEAEWLEAFATTGALFKAVVEASQGMGASTAAILLTAPEQVEPQRWAQNLRKYPAMQAHEWSLTQSTEQAKILLDAANIPTLDLLPLFQQEASRGHDLHLRDDGHWTADGHRLAGVATTHFLVEESLIPPLTNLSVPSIASALAPSQLAQLWRWFFTLIIVLLLGSLLWSLYKNGLRSWLRTVWAGLSTSGELLLFLIRRRQFVLLPLVVVLLLFGGLLIIAQASVVGPFIYTLF